MKGYKPTKLLASLDSVVFISVRSLCRDKDAPALHRDDRGRGRTGNWSHTQVWLVGLQPPRFRNRFGNLPSGKRAHKVPNYLDIPLFLRHCERSELCAAPDAAKQPQRITLSSRVREPRPLDFAKSHQPNDPATQSVPPQRASPGL